VNLRRKFYFACVSAATLPILQPAFAVTTWENQAERLQKVSATLLDNVPVGDPVSAETAVELRFVISFLPKVNPTVGGKTEKVPSSPVHTIPTVQLNKMLITQKPVNVGLQVWAGYLMPGAESLFGIKAKLSQYAFGAAADFSYALSSGELFWNMGFQNTGATLKGEITSSHSDDTFKTQNLSFYAAPGYHMPSLGLWANFLVGLKSGTSEFDITSDATNYKFTDTLSDGSPPFLTQIAAGWRHSSGLQVGAAELFVPKRLTMPRLIFSYQLAFK
jgi:hypothetical protein